MRNETIIGFGVFIVVLFIIYMIYDIIMKLKGGGPTMGEIYEYLRR